MFSSFEHYTLFMFVRLIQSHCKTIFSGGLIGGQVLAFIKCVTLNNYILQIFGWRLLWPLAINCFFGLFKQLKLHMFKTIKTMHSFSIVRVKCILRCLPKARSVRPSS